jgi:hypothetical protein
VTADIGKLVRCVVTATTDEDDDGNVGVGHAASNALGPITAAIPVNTVLPVISGTTAVGSTLTTTTGTWTNSPSGYAYQWKKGGVSISGATASSYVLVSGDVGGTITVTVTATNGSGSGTATSAGVGPVYVPIVLSSASAPDFCDIFVWGRATTDTGSGTLYAVVVPSAATTPSAAQIVAGTDAAGAAAPNASVAVSSTGVKNLLVRGLTATTAYKVCLAQQSGATLSNVVTASFTTDTLVAAFATNGLGTGLAPLAGSAAFGTNIADPHGGTNAIRWTDINDAATNQLVQVQTTTITFFNGFNKFHVTVKYQSGAPWFRFNSGSITVVNAITYWNTSTAALGTTTAPWTPTPVIWDLGSGWKMFSGRVDLTGADVTGVYNFNKGAVDNSIVGITRNGTHIQDLYNIRITRV